MSVHLKNIHILTPITPMLKKWWFSENVKIFKYAETKLLIWLKVTIVCSYIL